MSKPFELLQNGWQSVIDAFVAKADSEVSPSNLIALEDRLLYDASPLTVLLPEGIDSLESADSQSGLGDYDWQVATESESLFNHDDLPELPPDAVGLDRSLELVIVDAGVEDSDVLIEGLQNSQQPGIDWLIFELDGNRDGIDQITEILSDLSGLDAIHVISHGDGLGLQLGNARLDVNSTSTYAASMARWSNALNVDADILLYGCDLASTAEGRELIESIQVLCDCDVAASDDATGHWLLNADWDLEFELGTIETQIAFDASTQSAWFGVLDDSGWQSPTATGDDYNQWSNPTRAYSSDNSRASEGTTGQSQDYYNFGFGVPSGAAIDGIQIAVEGRDDDDGTRAEVEISWDGGATYTSTGYLYNLPENDGTGILGGTTNTWGRSWTADELSDANFRVRVTKGGGGTFEIDHIEARVHFTPPGTTTTFQQGVSGYTGTEDTELYEGNPTANLGGNTSINVDLDAVGGNEAQALIRFDDIFGSSAGQIPWNSQVISASLTVQVWDDATGATLSLHEMLQSWDESSNWSDFGGLQTGDELVSTADATITGEVGTKTFFGLESTVQNWANGGSNDGWGILTNSTSGWDFYSSEGTTAPILSITYIAPGSQPSTVHTLTVDTTSDVSDGDTTSIDALLADRGADGFISLREAILAANATTNDGANPDQINFNIGTSDSGYVDPDATPGNGDEYWVIQPTSFLGYITDPVVLDATTQTGYSVANGRPVIEIDASSMGSGTAGLVLRTDDSTIRGFSVHSTPDEGIEIDGSTGFGDNNTIQNNWVGIDAEGNVFGNAQHGIMMSSNADNNQIGGTGANDGNVVGGTPTGFAGIVIQNDSNSNTIEGNIVGLLADGTTTAANGIGILINKSSDGNQIGGTTTGAGNVISGNTTHGIFVDGTTDATYTTEIAGSVIQGNYIGVNNSGTAAVSNGGDGINLLDAINTTIGGSLTGAGNVISGNLGSGIHLAAGADNTTIQGNYIGTDVTGTTQIGNDLQDRGIYVLSSSNTIGGTATTERNTISGNRLQGVFIQQSSTTGNQIQGNYIGTTADGSAQLTNVGGGQQIGVYLWDTPGNTIGGTVAGAGNLISGNITYGIYSWGSNTSGNLIQGNTIGMDAAGTTAIGNGGTSGAGIHLSNVSANTIGGTANGAGNLISGNPGSGIELSGTTLTDVSVLGNSIYGNGTSAIDLNNDGTTFNDSNDSDSGANDLLNFPVLTSVVQNGANLDIEFDVDLPAGNYRIEFFDNPSGLSPSGFGGGETFIGSANITVTGASGYESFSTTLTGVTASDVLNVTTNATEADASFTTFGSTSEFGPEFRGIGVVTITTTDDNNDAGITNGNATHTIAWLLGNRGTDGEISLREAIIATNNTTNVSGNPDEIHFDISTSDAGYNDPDATPGNGDEYWSIALGITSFNQITDAVIIDGWTQSSFTGSPIIEIDGSGTASNDGFHLASGSDGSTIRGLVINGFDTDGIDINGSDNNTIQGNYIGTDITGTIGVGNTTTGINIRGTAEGNLIGGSGANEGNVIGDNGIGISISSASDNTIQGNFIGTDLSGTIDLGNGSAGIRVSGVTSGDNTIGGVNAGEGNVIAFNDNDGVQLQNGSGTDNAILGNLIYSNSQLGIDLHISGRDLNDPGDGDSGANDRQNYPELLTVETNGGGVFITGLLDTDGLNQDYRIEFFASATADGSGYGEAERFLGFIDVTTDGSGDATFYAKLSAAVAGGEFVTATATVNNAGDFGDTSEFALNVAATMANLIVVDTSSDINDGDTSSLAALSANKGADGLVSLREAIIASNNTALIGGNPNEIRFDIAGAGTHTISINNAADGSNGALPNLTRAVIVDATTQNGYSGSPLIELDGSATTGSTNGITISGGGSTIKGFIVHSFADEGIEVISDNNTVQGNWVGLNASGVADPNSDHGIILAFGASGNLIGGAGANEANVVSGNTSSGIFLRDSGTDGNFIYGNLIGLAEDGTTVIGNGTNGIWVSTAVANNFIGGTGAGEGNVIAGNSQRGIYVANSGTGNSIVGNYIGTDQSGSLDRGNLSHGIVIDNAASTTIGGTSSAHRNVISGNEGQGINITGGSIGSSILNNYIGLDAAGTVDLGNTGNGITVDGSSNNTTIGSATAGNVISGNDSNGINASNVSGLVIQGNYVGTNAAGTAAIGNTGDGVRFSASGVQLGGTNSGEGNVISANASGAVEIYGAVSGNTIEGNIIGLDATGTVELGATGHGILLYGGANNNTIGGTVAVARNIISGNTYGVFINGAGNDSNTIVGNYIGTDLSGTLSRGNTTIGVYVIGADLTAVNENVISGNDATGLRINGGTNSTITANLIGTDYLGTSVVGNQNGVLIDGSATGNTVGGVSAGSRNIISGNLNGVYISGTGTTSNTIAGNYIGTDITGALDLGNTQYGVLISAADGNTVGGSTSSHRNIISGNDLDGVQIINGDNNIIQGNYIGTNASGTAALANGDDGIEIDSASTGNQILDNLVSGNSHEGIIVYGDNNIIQGNYVGVNAAGTAAIGNGDDGIDISNASGNQIGGSGAGEGNLISGNGDVGIQIYGSASFDNVIQGNLIGTQADGLSALGNTSDGIWIANGASNNLIGGTDAGEGNTIAHNGDEGISVVNVGSDGNSILGNLIFANAALGLDLNGDGVTGNDTNDSDTGPNQEQNFPVITQAELNGSDLTVSGTLQTDSASTQYRIEFFGITSGNEDATHGEGRFFLGSTLITTDASGDASFNSLVLSSVPVGAGDIVTATATKVEAPASIGTDDLAAYGDTSEFAANRVIVLPNAAPNITFGETGKSYTENAPRITIDSTISVSDSDSTDFDGGALTVSFTAGGSPEDRLAVNDEGTGIGQVGISGTDVTYNFGSGAIVIGSFSGGTSGSDPLVISFNSNSDPVSAEAVAQQIEYIATGEDPSNATRTVQFVLTDGDGGTSTAISKDIDVTPVNDAPSFTSTNSTPTFNENGGPVSLFTGTSIDTIESGQLIISLTLSVSGVTDGNDEILMVDGEAIELTHLNSETTAANGFDVNVSVSGSDATVTITKSGNYTSSEAQTLVDGLAYNNTSESPSGAARVVTLNDIQDDGGTANGGDDTTSSGLATLVTIAGSNDAPFAVDDHMGLEFDGVDDVVVIADDPSLVMTNTLTMEAWIRPDASTNANRMIINKEGEYEVALLPDDRIYWGFTNTDPGWSWHDTGYTVTNGVWTHIAVTYDNGTVTTYVNGDVVDVYNGSGSIGDNYPALNELHIGGRSNNPANKFFDGRIDDVRIWNTARTQTEIQNNLGSTLTGSESGLAGYWQFSEGSGTNAADSTANGNDGTLVDGGSGTAGPQWTGYATNEDTLLNIAASEGLLSNDFDYEGDSLSVTEVNGNPANVGTQFTLSSGARLTVNAAGDFVYDPSGAFDHLAAGQTATDSFTYQIGDGNGAFDTATVTISIVGVNDDPTAITPSTFNVNENVDTSAGYNLGTLLSSDSDLGDSHTYAIVGGADQSSFSIGGGASDQLVLTAGVLDFETKSSYTVVVRTTDSSGSTHDETITVNVDDLNEAPTDIAPNSFNVNENTDTTSGFSLGTLTATDEDSGETFTYSIVGGADAANFSIGGVGADELIITDGVLDFETQSSYSVIVRVTDSGGNTYDETLTVNVNDLNETPTDITPNSFNVNENTDTTAGLSLGTLTATDEDSGETFTYSIVGGADAANFSIGGVGSDELIITDGVLDFESQSSYFVIVRVTDSGGNTYDETLTVNVNDLNETPTDIAPNSFNVNENTDTTSGFSVGTLTTTDEDTGETFTYSIVGGADAASFSIGGVGSDELILTDGVLDFETQSSYSVIVRVTDSGGNTYDETLTVNVNDLNETPTDIAPNSFNVNENTDTTSGLSLGTLTATDEDSGETFTYSIVGGADAANFSIGGVGSDELIITDGVLDFETQPSYTVTVRVTDSGGNTYDETLTVNVNNLNETPTDIAPNSFNVNDGTDSTSGHSVGTLTSTDEDAGETFTYTIIGGADAASFSIGGVGSDELIITDGVLDFETQATYTVIVRVTDSGGNTYDETLTVNITDVNEAPTDIAPDSFNVNENTDTTSGLSLGTLTATDPDAGETFTYSIVGGADAASFSIGGVGSDELIITDGVLDFETQSSYSVIVRVTDSGGNTYDETLTVNVNDLNETPTDIAPNSFSVNENTDTTSGLNLGTLTATDEDSGETFTYSIVGGADAANFSIGGVGSDELIITDGILDFETQSSYSVIVRVTDSGGNRYDETLTVNVNDLNETPTDIAPNSFNVNENTDTTTGLSVGTLTTTDEDTGETFTYSIVGGADAASFSIGGVGSDELIITDGVLDFETQSSYSVIVRVTDSGGNTYDETLTVNVNDLNETPTDIAPNSFNVNENTDTTSGLSLGTLTATDEDTGETFAYSIVGGADAASFSIGGVGSDELIITDGVLDFETQSSYTVIVRVTDSGGNTYDETLTVNVNDLNETPTDITPDSFNVNDGTDSTSGYSVGTLTTTDEDAGETFTYTIIGGADAASFSIGGVGSDELIITDGILDFETQASYTVTVRVTDSGGNTYDETLTVNITDVNEAPTDIAPDSFNVNENTDTTSGLSLGTLTATDPDAGETFTYSIVGGADAASFSIGGISSDELILTDGVLDFESQSSYSVVVRVTDSGGNTYDETLTVNVNDLNETPTDIAPNSFNINENTDTSSGLSLGTLSTTDEDAGETFTYSIVGGADAASFSIGGVGSDELIITDGILDFETQSSYAVIVRVTDSGGNTYDETLTVNVNDLNETPTDIAPNSFNVNENIDTTSGLSLGALTATDEDTGETFTYSIVGGADAANFSIGGVGSDELIITDGVLNFETQSSYSVIVRVTDSGGNTYDETLTVNVNDLNETPTDIAPNSFNVNENTDTTSGLSLGTLTATDEDTGETFAYSIVGGADAASFSIGGVGSDELIITDGVLDFETQSSYTVIVRVTDSGGNTYVETLTVNVNDLNETPTDIAPNSFNVNENTDTTSGFSVGTLTTTDEDTGETFTYSIVGGADAASFSIGGVGSDELIITDGILDFETQSSYSVIVRVTDSGSNTYDETLTVNVNDLNETPTDIAPNSFSVNENTDTASGLSLGTLTAADEDSGETFTYSIVGGADSASFSIGGVGSDELIITDGVLDFETQSSYTVIVRVTDSGGNTYDETLTVNVNDLNETPTDIAPNSFNVNDGTDSTSGHSVGTLTTTDEDAGETFTYTIIGGADAASFSIGGVGSDELIITDGILDFETQATYTVIVRVTDSGGNTYDETLTVNITDVNETPTDIAPDSFNVNENTDTTSGLSLGTLTATDPDTGETFTYSIVGGADSASFSVGGVGSDELIITDGILDFETQSSYSVIVRVTDSGGNTYDETLTVNVNDLNETPTDIAPNSFNINENTDTTSGLSLGTLSTTDEDAGETFTYSIVGGADAASFSIGGVGSDELIITDGILDFETQSSYAVIVRVTDSGGSTYDETLTVNVNDLNEAPTDIAPNSFNVNENTDTTSGFSVGTLTTTDEDTGETFTYSIVGGADAASFSIGGVGSDELILTDGILDFETQSSYSVIVRVTDSGGNTYDETLTVNVNDLNETPTDIAPNSFNVNENTDTTAGLSLGTLTATDEDSGETFTYSIVGGADAADFSIGGVGSDELIITDGVLDFETQSSYTVVVRVTDSGGNTYDETLTVNVNDLNETPTDIAPNSFNVNENTDTTSGFSVGTLTTTDEDTGETFTYSIVGGADAASFSIGGVGSDELILSDGVLDFETQSSYSVIVRVTDSGGNTYDETLTVNVNDLNETPTDISPNSFSVNENTDTTGGMSLGALTATDEDAGETFTYSIVGGADAARFSIGGAGSDELILTDGILDFETQSSYTVVVRVTDSGGNTYDEALLVSVNDLNEAPVVNNQSFNINENVPNLTSVGFIIASDVDAGDTVSFNVIGGTGQTAFSVNNSTGEITVSDSSLLDFETSPSFTLNIEVTDSAGLTDTGVITIALNDINDEQVLSTNLPLTVNEGAAATIDTTLLETTDQDNSPGQLNYLVTTSPVNGTLLLNGLPTLSFTQDDIDNNRLTYSHNGTETTFDSFDFEVDDGVGATTTGTFVILVNPINDAPIANDDAFSTSEGQTYFGASSDILSNDLDPENDPLTVALVAGPINGSVTLNPDGSFVYVHNGSETTNDSFTYRLYDGTDFSNVATVSINVAPVNDAPIGSDDNFNAQAGLILNELAGVLANDSDAEFNAMTAVLIGMPSAGTVTLNADGSFTYIPDDGFFGTDTFTYVPHDGFESGNITTVRIEVTAVPGPVVSPPTEPPVDPPNDPPTDLDLENDLDNDSNEEATENEQSEIEQEVNSVIVGAVRNPIGSSGVAQFEQFETADEIRDYLQIVTDRQEAEEVLKLFAANISPEIIRDSEELRQFRLLSGLAVNFDTDYLWDQLDDFEKQQGLASVDLQMTVGTVTAIGTLGYLFWSLRGGVLVAAALSHFPTWRMIDPLPVLESYQMKHSSSQQEDVGDFFE